MSGELLWYFSRAGGFVAFGLLALSVALGLVASLRLATPRWPRVLTTEVHRFVTMTGLAFTALHVVTIMVHPTEGFSLAATLIPFASERDTLATALGVVGMELAVAVWLSTYLRGRIGYRRWRQFHMLAFVAFGTSLVHGMLQGTDTGTGWGRLIYITCMAVVGGLLGVCILRPHVPDPVDEPPPATPVPPRTTPARPGPRAVPAGRSRAQLPPLPGSPRVSTNLPPLPRRGDRAL